MLLLRALARFHPDALVGQVRCTPAFPAHWLPLHITGVPVADAIVELDVTATGWRLEGLEGSGLDLEPPVRSSTPSTGP